MTFLVSYAAAQVLTTVTSNYRMLEDSQYSEVVRWGDQGDHFVVHTPSVLFGVRYVRPYVPMMVLEEVGQTGYGDGEMDAESGT